MAIDDHLIDPVFPREIECVILQMALKGDMNDAKNLLFVAKRVFDWLIPILYNVIVLDSLEEGVAWPPLPLPIAKLPQYGLHVHHLFVTRSTRDKNLDQYLKYCPNIVDFASWEELSQAQIKRVLRLPLSQLHLSGTAVRGMPLTPSTFALLSHVTHFEDDDHTFLSRLPSLSHFVDNIGGNSATIYVEFLQQHPRLKVLIVWVPDFNFGFLPEVVDWVIPELDDARVVHLKFGTIENWRMKAWGDPGNAWSFAERVVEGRLAVARAQDHPTPRIEPVQGPLPALYTRSLSTAFDTAP
ncbi:hypothetical protein BDN72DRAFT_834154 [Pluteus cervinus]|uniref:Uncharacterized protein n=1 Tax=Pluteus cervinus TaxID=181527 RepID=A0ACD3B7A4_9AGAR|nr:hypothetical protein BDN72DRAFT_834154 [Pluteus cervinus]